MLYSDGDNGGGSVDNNNIISSLRVDKSRLDVLTRGGCDGARFAI